MVENELTSAAPTTDFDTDHKAGVADIEQVELNALISQDSELVLTHILKDGSEVSGTLEQAMRLCPVIGEMTMQEARATFNDQALAQRIIERRRARQKAEEQEAPEKQTMAPAQHKPHRAHESQKDEIAEESPLIDHISPVINDTTTLPERIEQIAVSEQQLMEAEAAVVVEVEKSTLLVEDIMRKQAEIHTILESASVEQVSTADDLSIVAELESWAAETTKPLVHYEINPLEEIPEVKSNTLLPTEQPQEELEFLDELEPEQESNKHTEDQLSSELQPNTVATISHEGNETIHETAEIYSDEDVMDVYLHLIDANAVIEETIEQESEASYNATAKIRTISFEDFIESIPQPKERTTIEKITQHVAEEQPLEHTFTELAQYLSSEVDDTAQEKITNILKELDEMLVSAFEQADDLQQIAITPEITRSLLVLLNELGYENPQKILIEFVTRHDLEFLAQVVHYLYHIANEDNQQEFLTNKPKARVLVTAHVPTVSRWGRAIFGLINLQPVILEL
jgi:hypothetical protein